jgi:hypothetical protein
MVIALILISIIATILIVKMIKHSSKGEAD